MPRLSALLLTRRFAPLFWCQFFAAFGNNYFLNALVFLILFETGQPEHAVLIPLATAVFIAPFFFLSALGGEIADRFDMARLTQRLRLLEMGITIFAIIGFIWHSVAMLFVALLLFGVIAALFGPIKYGILPRILTRAELPAGNALVEGATFIAILLGTISGGLAVHYGGGPASLSFLMIILSLMSFGASLFMPPTGEAAPDLVIRRNILGSTFDVLKYLRNDRRMVWGAMLAGWFWAVGAYTLALVPPLVKNVLGGTEIAVTVCLAIFSIGIATGSGIAAWLAAGRIILWPTILAAALIGVFAVGLGWTTWQLVPAAESRGAVDIFSSVEGIQIAIGLGGLAISGGLLIVPVMAALQAWAGVDRRARVIASVNIVTAGFMVGGSLVNATLQAIGVTPPELLVILGIGSLLAALAIGHTLPASATNDPS